ncbi:MAG: hypothetical protein WCF36_15220 [Candidatus Nanopelagicales bacterium]
MATITQVKDRTTCSCTGMTLAAVEVLATDEERIHEYRIREWAYKGVWQLQELKDGAAGMTDTDYIDLGEFPTQEAALAHIESPTKVRSTR